MYLFVELYILAELGMTVIFKRLPTWIRRNLRNLAHSDSVRSLDSQNQPESWWDPGFQNTRERASFTFFHMAFQKKKKKHKKIIYQRELHLQCNQLLSVCSECKSRCPCGSLAPSQMQLSSPWIGTCCGRDTVPNGPAHWRHPTQLLSELPARLLSTDSLPTLIVAVRIKRAVSQLQCL